MSLGPTAGEIRIKTGSCSETGFFPTPPYSPTSCHSSDFLSDDFLSSGLSALEQLVSDSRFCPPAFPASHPYDDAAPAMCVPDSHLVPVCVPDSHRVPVCVPALDASEIPEHFLFGPDLTPEPSPSVDTHTHFLYGPPDSSTPDTHTHLLAHQIRSLDTHWPLLDETVIDGILRDLDAIRHSGCVCDGLAVRHSGCVCDGPSQLQHCLYAAIQ